HFRPDIPAGKRTWGANRDLDLGRIGRLAKEKCSPVLSARLSPADRGTRATTKVGLNRRRLRPADPWRSVWYNSTLPPGYETPMPPLARSSTAIWLGRLGRKRNRCRVELRYIGLPQLLQNLTSASLFAPQ